MYASVHKPYIIAPYNELSLSLSPSAVNVWLAYSQFAVDKMSVLPEGVAFPRDVFERAVTACGLHVGQSGRIWDAYITFEVALLRSLQV